MKISKSKCLGGMALSMLCLSVGTSNAGPIVNIPNFSPFDIGVASDGYILGGTVQARGLPAGPGYMVLDPANQRIAFRFEGAGLGSFVTLPEGTYNFNLPGTGGACFLYPGFDYAKFKQRFAALSATPGATNRLARYTGYAYDSSSCNQPASATFVIEQIGTQQTPAITKMEFAIPTPRGGACVQGQAYWTANIGSIDTTSDRNQAFVLPASCSNPISWCDVAYPAGNACNIKHSTPNDINS